MQLVQKRNIVLILLIIFSGVVYALNGVDQIKAHKNKVWKKHEVSIIYGLLPFSWHNIWDDYSSVGMFSSQYMFTPIKWLSIGVMLGYQHFYSESYRRGDNSDDVTSMFMLRINYVNKPKWTLYSKAGIGIVKEENEHGLGAALQLPLIGTTFNIWNSFYGLSEIGFGSQGSLMLGLGYKF